MRPAHSFVVVEAYWGWGCRWCGHKPGDPPKECIPYRQRPTRRDRLRRDGLNSEPSQRTTEVLSGRS